MKNGERERLIKQFFKKNNMTLVLGENCGVVKTKPTTDPSGFGNWGVSTRASALRITAPENSIKLTEIGWWDNNSRPNADVELGIYSHDSTNNRPNILLDSVTSSKGTVVGWKYFSFYYPIDAGTTYWLGIQVDSTIPTTLTDYETTGGYFAFKASQTSLPTTWGISTFYPLPNQLIALYAMFEYYEPLDLGFGHQDFRSSGKPPNLSIFWKGHIADEVHYEPHLSEYSGISTNLAEMPERVIPTRGQTGPDVNAPLTPLLPHIKRNKDNHLEKFLEGKTLHNKTLFTRKGQKGARFGEGVDSGEGLLKKWAEAQKTKC